MDLIEELVRLAAALTEAGVEYAVCGGVALAIHGHPRFTKDIDILILAKDLDRALAVAAARGFVLEVGKITFQTGSPDQRTIFRVSKAQGTQHLILDLLLSGKEHDLAWATRRTVMFEGRPVGVVSREGLIEMKRAAGRGQDLLDIEKLAADDTRDERG